MPQLAILCGPNGAGKTTLAPRLLHELLGMRTFVNADVIASGLSLFDPAAKALEAGRYMLAELKRLANAGEDFAFETTLASRSFAPWIDELALQGYESNLLFICLPSAEEAIERVAHRVARGGHHVPDDVVRRRYTRGLTNFFRLYQPRALRWQMYNGVTTGLIAEGGANRPDNIREAALWDEISQAFL